MQANVYIRQKSLIRRGEPLQGRKGAAVEREAENPEMPERSTTEEELISRAALISVSIPVFPYKSPLFACINLNDFYSLSLRESN